MLLASEVLDEAIEPTGGTPLYQTVLTALEAEPRATRIVAFSDGQPNRYHNKGQLFSKAKALKIPVDTVFLSSGPSSWADGDDSSAIKMMRELADETGGIFLDLSKGDFRTGLKYLAPVKRLLLADASFKAQVERGRA